ncbi:Gfo/Idh/MocA family oxidoreductase [Marinomonas sp. 15G1-11]|uniref:Gfo/Idh/MocA family oxidoreductase n=1 Tax=Marinomonas phaeophyticola TaxID=3004091 RepID=A0ABT4JWA1_9GAMM|nr:Gfo/Idh/MocA family oxidoreductase [Marinomonas sp. 15G1-11]MCZ2722630.1 Gfo/Idh/MocA family oxidoreductase [Marinomonas sp. 15G1-11]
MSKEKINGQLFSYSGPAFHYLNEEERHFFAKAPADFRVSLIGCGMIGMEHMRVATRVGRTSIHGVFDTNERSIKVAREEFAKVTDEDFIVYDSLEAACNDPEIDGIMICTPNYTHLDILKVAIKSGKPIFMEKPMATKLEDAYEITKMAKEYDSVLQIGLQYRYKSIYAEAIHEVLERRAVGDVKMINIMEHRIPFLDKVNQWNKFSKYSGGTLVEKCCHYFDLLNLFAQSRPVRVHATGSQSTNFIGFEFKGEKSDILDSAFVTVEYENGVRAGFNLCMFAPMFHEEVVICGDEGRVKAAEMEDFGESERLRTEMEVFCGQYRPSKTSKPSYPKLIEDSGHNGATWFEHIAFADQMAGKKTNSATVEEGFWSIVVGSAAEESVNTGKIIEINEFLQSKGIDL